nr:PglZ domain-containing protein [Methanobrevibacter smithii]
MKWYDSLIKKIEDNGNSLFLYDLECLLNDKNFYKDLSQKYEIFCYKEDSDYFHFINLDSSKSKLIYSNKHVQRSFTQNAIKISSRDVFDKLDYNILKNMDVKYYQTLFNYCMESEANNFIISRENTLNIIFQCIWGINLSLLFNPTENLRVALEYLIDETNLDDFIIEKISNNLKINLKELYGDDVKIHKFIEDLIINYISENQFRHEFDLSNNYIQYYLTKYDLKSQIVSDNLNEKVLNKYPWLIKFKLTSDSKEQKLRKINSEILEFEMYYDKIYADDILDLNDWNDIFKLSKKFATILYEIQSNELKLDDFNMNEYYNKTKILFKSILEEKLYVQLFNYSYKDKPYTVDRILDFINFNFKDENIALIVMDGMSYDEWFILKEYLDDFKIKELESFSILPSITLFSRTSIFAGKTPNRFLTEAHKIKSNAEEKGFKEFFMGKNILENDILYGRIDLNNEIVKNHKEQIEWEYLQGYKALGLICNLFDDESHSIKIFGENKSNLYKNIKSAIDSSNLINLIKKLKEYGYKIILTADHGNIYCEGNGIKANKMLEFEHKSSRCLIFDNELFADKIVETNPQECFKYQYNILSKDLFLVFAVDGCFDNNASITHGSISPEECIVPVVILQ